MVLLTVQNLGSATADVVIDAMIAEAVRFERYVHNMSFFVIEIWVTYQIICKFSLSVNRRIDAYNPYQHWNF